MFCFFSLSRAIAVSRTEVFESGIEAPRRKVSDFPSFCNISTNKDVSELPFATIDLVADVPVCVKVKGTIFVNGDDIELTGYTNNVKMVEGVGVAATLGSDTDQNIYVFQIKSSDAQTINVFGSICIEDGSIAYVTTKNHQNSIDILEETRDKMKPAYFIILGPKASLNFHVYTSLTSADGIIQFLEGNNHTFSSSTDKDYYASATVGVIIIVNGQHRSSKCKIEFSSFGNEWESDINGFITFKANTIYEDDDFYIPRLAATSIVLAVIFCIVVAVVAFLFIYCIFCRKSKQAEENQKFENQEPLTYSPIPPEYGAPPQYQNPPPLYENPKPQY
jgi:hypothetical protein